MGKKNKKKSDKNCSNNTKHNGKEDMIMVDPNNLKSLQKQLNLQSYVTATIGLPTLKDILKELDKPGLDPRGKAKSFELRKCVC